MSGRRNAIISAALEAVNPMLDAAVRNYEVDLEDLQASLEAQALELDDIETVQTSLENLSEGLESIYLKLADTPFKSDRTSSLFQMAIQSQLTPYALESLYPGDVLGKGQMIGHDEMVASLENVLAKVGGSIKEGLSRLKTALEHFFKLIYATSYTVAGKAAEIKRKLHALHDKTTPKSATIKVDGMSYLHYNGKTDKGDVLEGFKNLTELNGKFFTEYPAALRKFWKDYSIFCQKNASHDMALLAWTGRHWMLMAIFCGAITVATGGIGAAVAVHAVNYAAMLSLFLRKIPEKSRPLMENFIAMMKSSFEPVGRELNGKSNEVSGGRIMEITTGFFSGTVPALRKVDDTKVSNSGTIDTLTVSEMERVCDQMITNSLSIRKFSMIHADLMHNYEMAEHEAREEGRAEHNDVPKLPWSGQAWAKNVGANFSKTMLEATPWANRFSHSRLFDPLKEVGKYTMHVEMSMLKVVRKSLDQYA